MLVRLDNNQYIFLKRNDYTSDKEYYNLILKHKYKTSLKKHVPTKQKIIRYVNG